MLSLGLSLTTPLPPVIDPAAEALFARMTVQPDATRKKLINDAVVASKAAGLWNKLDALWLMAAHDAQAAGLNLISSNYTLSPVNSPTFTVDRGYQGNGTTSYLNTGINFSPLITKASQDSHSFGIFQQATQSESTAADMGNPQVSLNTARTGMTSGIRSATSALDTPATSTGGVSGAYTVSRTNSSAYSFYQGNNTVVLNNRATASVALNSERNILICAFDIGGSVTGFTNRPYCGAWVGGGLTSAEVFALHSIINNYNNAVGAA